MKLRALILSDERRYFIISPKFQLHFLSYMICVALISVLAIYSIGYLFFYQLGQASPSLGFEESNIYYQTLDIQKTSFRDVASFCALTLCTFLIAIGVGFSHLICGPLYRMESHMKQVTSGKRLKPVKLRRFDFFGDLADALNILLDRSALIRGKNGRGGEIRTHDPLLPKQMR